MDDFFELAAGSRMLVTLSSNRVVARAALPDQLAEIVDVPQELGMHELDVRRLHSCLKHIRITKQVV